MMIGILHLKGIKIMFNIFKMPEEKINNLIVFLLFISGLISFIIIVLNSLGLIK